MFLDSISAALWLMWADVEEPNYDHMLRFSWSRDMRIGKNSAYNRNKIAFNKCSQIRGVILINLNITGVKQIICCNKKYSASFFPTLPLFLQTKSCHVTQAGPELKILLPPYKSWSHMCTPTC